MREIKTYDLAVCLALFDSLKILRSLFSLNLFVKTRPDSLPFDRDKILGVNITWPEGSRGVMACVWSAWRAFHGNGRNFVSFRRRSNILFFICSCDCKEKSPRVATGEA